MGVDKNLVDKMGVDEMGVINCEVSLCFLMSHDVS